MRMCKICGDLIDIVDNYLITTNGSEEIFICDMCLETIIEMEEAKKDE